jgi:hypothetical protein
MAAILSTGLSTGRHDALTRDGHPMFAGVSPRSAFLCTVALPPIEARAGLSRRGRNILRRVSGLARLSDWGAMELILSLHSIERFQQRLRPALSVSAAGDELERLMAHAEFSVEPPLWAASTPTRTHGWLMVGDDIAFPLVATGRSMTATTCLCRRPRASSRRRRGSNRGAGRRPRRS